MREAQCKVGARCFFKMLIPTEGIHVGHQCRYCKEFYLVICVEATDDNLCSPSCVNSVYRFAISSQPMHPTSTVIFPTCYSAPYSPIGTFYAHSMFDVEKCSNVMVDPFNFISFKYDLHRLDDIAYPSLTSIARNLFYEEWLRKGEGYMVEHIKKGYNGP